MGGDCETVDTADVSRRRQYDVSEKDERYLNAGRWWKQLLLDEFLVRHRFKGGCRAPRHSFSSNFPRHWAFWRQTATGAQYQQQQQYPFNSLSRTILTMLWVDKYRPSNLEDLDYHDEISRRLQSLAKNPASLPHLFFYGPSGAGKRTRINAFLGALFGPTAYKLKLAQRTFTTPTGRSVDIHMIESEHHIELSPGDAGNNDRFVIQDVLKDIASSKNISSSLVNMDSNTTSNKNSSSAETEIKVVVLNQVDKLSRQAQAALRRTMEKYASTCRLILCCDSPSKLIAPLRSRCLGIRVGAPTEEQVRTWKEVVLVLFVPFSS
jgi:hypothetical protein